MRLGIRMLLALCLLALPLHVGALQDEGGLSYSNSYPVPVTPRDAAGDSAVDATANAVKTVDVDNAGTLLVGGRGSRVELLTSGTSTDVATASTLLVTCTLPAWAHSLQFHWYVRAAVAGTAGTLALQASPRAEISDAQVGSMLALGGATAPVATEGGWAIFGPAAQGSHGSVTAVGSLYTYTSPIASRVFKFYRTIATNPATSISLEYACYAYGG